MTLPPSAAPPSRAPSAAPLFRFGLLSDLQWADIDDGHSFHGVPRYYRAALCTAHRAVDAFKQASCDFVIHLGDIVDYHNSLHGTGDAALEKAVQCFEALDRPTLHAIGNHCLYNAPRHVLNHRLGIDRLKAAMPIPPYHEEHSYYSFDVPGKGFKLIMLDGYDISLLGWQEGHPHHRRAVEILESRNPNENKNSNSGLEGLEKRFVAFGGGVSAEQMAWFEAELQSAKKAGFRVIVCCHLCLHPETCAATCLLYNYDEVLDLMKRYPGTIAAALSGHAHRDGYYLDEASGIHFRVCKAILETPPDRDCWGIVSCWEECIEIEGADTFASGMWELRSKSCDKKCGHDARAGEVEVKIGRPTSSVDA